MKNDGSKKNLCLLIGGIVVGAGAVIAGVAVFARNLSRKRALAKIDVDELCREHICDREDCEE